MNKKRAKTSNNNKFSSKVIENLKNRPWGYPWADLARNGAIVSIFALATLLRQENRRSDVFQIRHIQSVQSVVEKVVFWTLDDVFEKEKSAVANLLSVTFFYVKISNLIFIQGGGKYFILDS